MLEKNCVVKARKASMCDYMIMCVTLPGQDVLQRLHQSHLLLSGQRGLEEDLRTPQTLRPHKQLVVLRHVEHRLETGSKLLVNM